MKAFALLAVLALFAQTLTPSPQDLLNLARPLTPTEIATVLTESRRALTADMPLVVCAMWSRA
jgi:hypothetical protein